MNIAKSRLPCGMCDAGIYSEESLLNRDAIKFLSLSEDQRLRNIPRCKSQDRQCIGFKDLHDMKVRVDRVADRIKREASNETD